MTAKQIIGPKPVSTPADLKISREGSRTIPDDLLRAASLRLGVMSLLFAVLWAAGAIGGHIAG
ncbi:MAG: hypothetical protein ACRENK_10170, partial [Gemmatimonadaceae bacterium]